MEMGADAFSEMPGGRPSSFHGVTEWGTPWLPLDRAGEQRRGEASPVRYSLQLGTRLRGLSAAKRAKK